MNWLLATLYAILTPDSPGVDPPGYSSSIDFRIFSFSLPDVGCNQTPMVLPYTTIEMVSLSRRLFTSNEKADFSKGRRLGISIEPETSIRKTRLLGGIFSDSSLRAEICRESNWFV